MKVKLAIGIITSLLLLLMAGCSNQEKIKKVADLDFTVVTERDIPQELLHILEEKKQQPFKMTYTNESNTYIIVGYGQQATGGYSISVTELFLAENAVYIKTNLIGPQKEERQEPLPSYPYIVVKTKILDEAVVFQ